MIRITLFEKEWEKSREFATDVVTIGRSRENALEIKETSISRLHCEIVFVGGQAMLINHAKTNGTLVNGKLVGETILKTGDEILIGRVKMRFDGASQGLVPPPVKRGSTGPGVKKKLMHRRRRD